ncbi:ydg sra domain-containing protein [Apiospora marii]|uniref:Ydg sra domain-containing protein n=1 Tax=Apiospora marii TaxID=335849 RepID=A0ABR1RBL0_9PEZI
MIRAQARRSRSRASISAVFKGATSNNANEEAPAVQISIPGARDPLFGTNGIMHGVISTRNAVGRRVYMLNPRLPHQSRRVFGHNGLSVGQWFAMWLRRPAPRRVTGPAKPAFTEARPLAPTPLWRATRSTTSSTRTRASSCTYSAPRAHENKDPHQLGPASSGSLALRASHASRKPVRVLRAAGAAKISGCPGAASGGLYEQFKLVRLGPNINGHEELKDIAKDLPSAEQAAAYRNLMDRD